MAKQSQYNHAAAFIAFCRGTTPEDIAQALAIPLSVVKGWIRIEGWHRLAGEFMPKPAESVPAKRAERDLERIQENREKNLRIAQALQADLLKQVELLRDGQLKIERIAGKNAVRMQVEPTPRDRADLANYAKSVADLSYRALGDMLVAREAEGLPPQAASVTIILPAQIAAPRIERNQLIDSEKVTIVELSEAAPLALPVGSKAE